MIETDRVLPLYWLLVSLCIRASLERRGVNFSVSNKKPTAAYIKANETETAFRLPTKKDGATTDLEIASLYLPERKKKERHQQHFNIILVVSWLAFD